MRHNRAAPPTPGPAAARRQMCATGRVGLPTPTRLWPLPLCTTLLFVGPVLSYVVLAYHESQRNKLATKISQLYTRTNIHFTTPSSHRAYACDISTLHTHQHTLYHTIIAQGICMQLIQNVNETLSHHMAPPVLSKLTSMTHPPPARSLRPSIPDSPVRNRM